MKKIIGILVFLLLIFSAGIYYYMNQPKNIFDEIYQETEKTYRLNNIFNKLTDVEVHSYQEYSDDSKFYPSILYKDIAKTGNYTKIAIDFSFLNKNNNILIVSHGSIISTMKRLLDIKTSHIQKGKVEIFNDIDFEPLVRYMHILENIEN